MAFAMICLIIASAFWCVAAALVLADEAAFLGLNPIEWLIFGAPFHGLGHWVPGHTGNPG